MRTSRRSPAVSWQRAWQGELKRDRVASLRQRLERLRGASKGEFLRSIAVLAGGTAFAQALTVAALPILTRLYGPEDFNVLAVYAAILSTVSVISCLRFEIAIPLPESDKEAVALLLLALLLPILFGASLGLFLTLFPGSVADRLGVPSLAPYLWMVPLGVWLSGTYAALQYWTSRKRRFKTVAQTRVVQALGGTATQLSIGALHHSPLGLLFGHMISAGAGVVKLGSSAWVEVSSHARLLKRTDLIQTARAYRRFPIYSAPEALANSAGIQIPILMIAALAIGPLAGLLFVAKRIMAAPMALISGAVAQVYLSHAPEHHRSGNLDEFTAKTIGGLGKTAAGPILAIGVLAPGFSNLILGDSWSQVGEVILWLAPWVLMQLLTSPVSMALHVTGRQRVALYLQLAGLVMRVGAILLAYMFFEEGIVQTYAASGFVFYTMYLLVICQATSMSYRRLMQVLVSILPLASAWVLLAIGIRWAWQHFAAIT